MVCLLKKKNRLIKNDMSIFLNIGKFKIDIFIRF